MHSNNTVKPKACLWVVVCASLVLAPFVVHFVVAQPVHEDLYFANFINKQADTLSNNDPHIRTAHPVLGATANYPVVHFVVSRYFDWSGRFTSDFLIAVWVVWLGEAGLYPLVLAMIFTAVAASIYLFLSAMGRGVLSPLVALSYTLFSCAWWVAVVPALNENLYWVVVTLTYMAPIPLLLFTFWYLWKAVQSIHTAPRVVLCLHAVVLFGCCFVLTGFNEALMAILFPVLGVVGVRSARKGVLAVGIIAGVVVGAAVVLGAPGNANRYLIFPLSKDIWLTLGGSVIGGAFLSIAFVGMSAVLYCIPAIRTITRALVAPYARIYGTVAPSVSLWQCLLYLALPAFTLAPLLWGGGGPGPLRVYGPIIMLMIVGWPFFLASLSALVHSGQFPILNRIHNVCTRLHSATRLKVIGVVALLILIVVGVPPILIPPQQVQDRLPNQIASGDFSTLQIVNLAANDFLRGNIRQVYVDTATNTFSYYRTLKQRSQLVQEAQRRTESTVELPPFQRISKTVYLGDIVDDPAYYYNRAYAAFYGVEAVHLSTDTHP